jgi:DNA polymerase-3 subunit epsilon
VNPGRDSHEEALKVHGITSEFLKDKPKFSEVAQDLLDYLKDAHVVIHNAPFDLGFLNMEFSLLGQPLVKSVVASVTDTLVMAKEMFPGKRNSLDALCDRLEVDNSGRTLHGALLDAELLADVFINLTRGQEALLMDDASALDASGNKPVAMNLSGFVLPVMFIFAIGGQRCGPVAGIWCHCPNDWFTQW